MQLIISDPLRRYKFMCKDPDRSIIDYEKKKKNYLLLTSEGREIYN